MVVVDLVGRKHLSQWRLLFKNIIDDGMEDFT
jgi:hypothetical protein